jgi:hypothetical protein
MNYKFLIALLSFVIIAVFSPRLGFAQAVLIEENNQDVQEVYPAYKRNSNNDGWTKKEKALAQSKPLREIYSHQEFTSARQMKMKRRVGVGLAAAGQLGLGGALIDLNFTPDNSFVIGFGGGPLYSSYSFQAKYSFSGQAINPYLAFGLAHWASTNGSKSEIGKTTPSFLGSRYLNSDEIKSGSFAKTFLIPSAGLQYNQLFGSSVGTSLFAEVFLFMLPENLSPMPTGSLGVLYYF